MTVFDWALCDKDTGEVEQVMSVNNNVEYDHAGFLNGKRIFLIPSDSDHDQVIRLSYYDYETQGFLARGERPSPFYHWTTNKQWEINTEDLVSSLKLERNYRLISCDWTQSADSPLSDSKKAEWATYRQALRDVPANIPEEVDSLSGYPWPASP